MKIAVLNCSDIARRRIIPAIQSIPGMEIVIVKSRDLDRAYSYAEEFGILLYTDDIEDVISTKPDLAYISAPPSEHYQLIDALIQNGIHVLCEKPFTTDSTRTESILRDAERMGVIVQENYAFPFHHQWKFIEKSIPELGDLLYIRSSFEFPPRDKSTDFRYNKDLGGGSLMDAGGYPIKAASLLLGNINLGEISGSHRFCRETEVDLSGNVYFEDDKGTAAFLTWSFESPYRCDLEIVGNEGRIYANKIFTPKPDETVSVKKTDLFGKIIEIQEFKCDHFRELLLDLKRRIEEGDTSNFKQILKQSNWQSYAKTTSFRAIVN